MMEENDTSTMSTATPVPVVGHARQNLALLCALLALALAGWQWHRADLHEAEAGKALAEAASATRAQNEQFAALQTRLSGFEKRFGEIEAQNDSLQGLAQEIARGREEVLLIEVEQAVTLAAQQLQLAGNVPVALLALQNADARLARLDRPQYLPLRKALAKDIEHLGALPFVDLPGLTLRLEQVLAAVDKLPLAGAGRLADTRQNVPLPEGASWWQKARDAVWQEISGLVRIQRFDGQSPLLVAPGQEVILRENLKLRLLSAKLALLARDQAGLRSELGLVADGLKRHFAADDKAVQGVLAQVRPLASLELNAELPNLNATQALRGLRNVKEKR